MSGIAVAGGSWLETYRAVYPPGGTVVMSGEVSPGQLGWVSDGPFYAYLRVEPKALVAAEHANRFPYVHETDLPLGSLNLTERSDGWVSVSITFLLPSDIPNGDYWVVYCNDPCTEGLGDLMGGVVRVSAPRPAPLPGMAPRPVGVHIV